MIGQTTVGQPDNQDETQPWISWSVLFGLLAFCMALASPYVFVDPDSMWHVKAGEWMLENSRIHRTDAFSHSMPGAHWYAHEWGSEILMAAVYRAVGWSGVHLMVAIAFSVSIVIVCRYSMLHLQPVHAVTLLSISAALAYSHFLARPHVLAWPMLTFWIASLARSVERGIRPSWWLVPLLVIWVNLHGSFMLGLVFCALFALEAVSLETSRNSRLKALKTWAAFGLCAAFATLLNPSGFGLLRHTVEVMGKSVAMSFISEWRSTDFHEFHLFTLWLAILAAIALTGRLRLSFPRVLMLLAVTYLSLKHVRYHSLVGLIAPFVLAPSLAREWAVAREARGGASKVDNVFKKLMKPARVLGATAAMGITGTVTALSATHWQRVPAVSIAPAEAVDSALASGATGRVLNDYGFGGYLIFRDIPVFVDGRSDMYGDPFLKAMNDAVELRKSGAIERLLDRYEIDWTIFRPERAVVQYLDKLANWERVYGDSIAVVHLRTVASTRSTDATNTAILGASEHPE